MRYTNKTLLKFIIRRYKIDLHFTWIVHEDNAYYTGKLPKLSLKYHRRDLYRAELTDTEGWKYSKGSACAPINLPCVPNQPRWKVISAVLWPLNDQSLRIPTYYYETKQIFRYRTTSEIYKTISPTPFIKHQSHITLTACFIDGI